MRLLVAIRGDGSTTWSEKALCVKACEAEAVTNVGFDQIQPQALLELVKFDGHGSKLQYWDCKCFISQDDAHPLSN